MAPSFLLICILAGCGQAIDEIRPLSRETNPGTKPEVQGGRIRYSPNGRMLLSALWGAHDTGQIEDDVIITEDEGNISIWDIETKRLVAKRTSNKEVHRVDFSPDSRSFAIVDVNGTLEIWDVDTFITKHRAGSFSQ